LIERYGQVQVTGKADGKPLPKVYVKVFAQVKQFAILVISDEAGARMLTAAPPAR
jgi:hypothetical protein